MTFPSERVQLGGSLALPEVERAAWNEPRWVSLRTAVLVLFLLLAYGYVWVVQPGFGPDEPRHFNYVKRLAEKGRLPLKVGPNEEDGAHTLHPPLYYLLASPIYLATRGLGDQGAMRAIKHLSPLLLLAALILFTGTLRRVFPDRPFAGAAALGVVALLPLFQLEASVMNNDSLAVLLGALFLWHLVRTWHEPPSVKSAVIAGLIMAAFVNTKATGLTLSPLWAVALHFRAAADPTRRKEYLRDLAIGYGLLLALGTWWYLRNYLLYGQPVPLDFGPMDMLRPRNLLNRMPMSPIEVYTTGAVVHYGWRSTEGLFQSFWSQIDWISEQYRPAVYAVLAALVTAAVAGLVRYAAAWWRESPRSGRWPVFRVTPLGTMGLAFVLNWLHTWYIATFMHMGFYQGGRYLMPAVFGAGALLGAGWDTLIPRRAQFPCAVLLVFAMVGLNVLCLVELVTVLNPTYVR